MGHIFPLCSMCIFPLSLWLCWISLYVLACEWLFSLFHQKIADRSRALLPPAQKDRKSATVSSSSIAFQLWALSYCEASSGGLTQTFARCDYAWATNNQKIKIILDTVSFFFCVADKLLDMLSAKQTSLRSNNFTQGLLGWKWSCYKRLITAIHQLLSSGQWPIRQGEKNINITVAIHVSNLCWPHKT